MPAFDYDLVIIGGRSCGSTLARLLPADMRILLVEKNTAQPPFRKPCRRPAFRRCSKKHFRALN